MIKRDSRIVGEDLPKFRSLLATVGEAYVR